MNKSSQVKLADRLGMPERERWIGYKLKNTRLLLEVSAIGENRYSLPCSMSKIPGKGGFCQIPKLAGHDVWASDSSPDKDCVFPA